MPRETGSNSSLARVCQKSDQEQGLRRDGDGCTSGHDVGLGGGRVRRDNTRVRLLGES